MPQVAGLLSDGSRGGEAVGGYLPQGYSYEQWQNDVRRWEAETGYRYEDYVQQVSAAHLGCFAARRAVSQWPAWWQL